MKFLTHCWEPCQAEPHSLTFINITTYSTDQKKPNRERVCERERNGYKNANGTGTERVQNGYRTVIERIQNGYESQKSKKAF